MCEGGVEGVSSLTGRADSIPFIGILTSFKELALKALLDSIDVHVENLHIIQNPLSVSQPWFNTASTLHRPCTDL